MEGHRNGFAAWLNAAPNAQGGSNGADEANGEKRRQCSSRHLMWNATNWHVDFLLFVGVVQVTGNLLLLLGSISLGLLAYLVSDSRQRRAFLDTRQSFEMRLTIEEQAREQVNICWFSIFPGSVQWSLTNGFSFLGTRRLFCILLFFWDFDGLRRVDGPWHSFNHRPRWFLPLFFHSFQPPFWGSSMAFIFRRFRPDVP